MYCNKNNLNRSHSESDLCLWKLDNLSVSSPRDLHKGLSNNSSPIVRRVYVEEIFSIDDNFSTMRRTRFSKIIDDSSCSPRLARIKKEKEIAQGSECEEVPMDIDGSYDENFPNIMGKGKINKPVLLNETDNQTTTFTPQGKRARVISINPVRKKESRSKRLFLFIIGLSIFFYYIFCTNIFTIVNSDIQNQHIQTDLVANVHGQKQVVESIISTLKNRNSWEDKVKVLSFVGSQGVGKTYIASLIKNHFRPNLVHEIYSSELYYQVKKQEIVDAINSCCLNLIIIDDLRLKDNTDLHAFIHSLPEDTFILLITIFNIHYMDYNMNTIVNHKDIIKIRDGFHTSGIKNYELLVFEDFSKEQIKDWMKKQVQLKNVKLSAEEEILQNLLNDHNIKHGLKGLHSKMFLEFKKDNK